MSVFDQIYNGCAMLPGLVDSDKRGMDRMDRHRLLSSLYRIRVALGEIDPATNDGEEAADAYMAGYEK